MTDEEIKVLQDEKAALELKAAELQKQIEAEKAEKKEIINKRDSVKAEKAAIESRVKELEDKVKLTESEKAELAKLADAKEAKIQEIETQRKAELLSELDDSHKKLAEKLSVMDLAEYVKLNGKQPGVDTRTKTKQQSEKPKSATDWYNQREK